MGRGLEWDYDLMNFGLSKSLKMLGDALRSSSESKSSLVVKKTHAIVEISLKVNNRPDKCKLKHKPLPS